MRGQTTVFIIIGVLILIAFGVTFYAVNRVRVVSDQPHQLERLGAQPVQDYVDTCLNLAVTEGLQLMGKQGGLIYDVQGGIHDSNVPGEDFDSIRVPYVVLPPKGNVGELFFSDPPRYPFDDFPYTSKGLYFKGYYGQNQLAPLYKLTPDDVYVNGSIQESLESFIAKQTVACADWSVFTAKDYVVKTGSAVAALIFAKSVEQFEGEQFVSVKLEWPVEVSTPGGDKLMIDSFSYRAPVRLATIYYTVKEMIDSDVTDVSYVPSGSGAFTVERVDRPEFSMLKINDTLSSVGNMPFEFWVSRANRIPALWKINTSLLNDATFHVTPEGRGAKITVTDNMLRIEDPCQEAAVPNPYILELNASDPDENDVVFDVDLIGGDDEIPSSAIGRPFAIVVSARDQSETSLFDSQKINLEVALCEVR